MINHKEKRIIKKVNRIERKRKMKSKEVKGTKK